MTDPAQLAARFRTDLTALGLPEPVVTTKAESYVRCDAALDALQAEPRGRLSLWVPGRIEVFGKHTDYAGGRSLLCAVERGFCVRVAPRQDATVQVIDPATGRCTLTSIDRESRAPDGDWSNYVATVARRIARNFPDARTGADIAFVSDLPLAAGLSSSSALLISVFGALAAVNRLSERSPWRRDLHTPAALATYLGAVENGGTFGTLEGDTGVGTLGGCQDQTAILCCDRGQLVEYSWLPVQRHRGLPLPRSHTFVIGSCGVTAEKSAGAREQYNRAALLVRHLLHAWNERTGNSDVSLAAALRSDAGAWQVLSSLTESSADAEYPAQALHDRLEQFVLETYSVIPGAANALRKADWAAFGTCATTSMNAAADWLGNQIPETMALARLARANGAVAASAFGAGFGGAVWALVPTANVERFTATWQDRYLQEFPAAAQSASFFATGAGPGARLWYDHPTEPKSLPPRRLYD